MGLFSHFTLQQRRTNIPSQLPKSESSGSEGFIQKRGKEILYLSMNFRVVTVVVFYERKTELSSVILLSKILDSTFNSSFGVPRHSYLDEFPRTEVLS